MLLAHLHAYANNKCVAVKLKLKIHRQKCNYQGRPKIEQYTGVAGKNQFFPMNEDQRLIPANKWKHPEDAWTELDRLMRNS